MIIKLDNLTRIGVFDSGVGGLTVLKSLLERLPNESYLYLGDSANLPYEPRALKSLNKDLYRFVSTS